MNKLYSLLAFLFFSQIYAVNFTVNNIRYTGSDNAPYTATVTGHTFSFFGAADLSTVTYNGNNYTVTSIGINAFSGSRYLTSVTIGHAVTSIGDFAFKSCTSLASVTIPNSVTSIGNSAFGSCNSLTSITIPNSVTSIGNAAFEYCTGLTYVTIGNSVTSIRYNAFFSCTSLTSVTIPNSVTSIESNVFSFCSSLTSVTIPNSVTSIGSQAFYNCTNLTTVNCYVLNPIAISADVFQIINQSACALNVPIGSEAAYEAAAVWTNFNPINGNLNIAPTDILLSASAINENKAANSTVGTFGSTDANTADTFTYTLVAGTGSTDNTSFNISGNTLTINASPDFETKSSYLIRVRTTDNGDLSFEKEFTITVNNVNEAPTDISLSASAINENVAGNSSVGIFSSIDADAANTFTYTLVAGTGSTDNASFNISGNSLRITASPDFETKSSYAIRIRTTDQGNLFFEKQFTVAINNLCDVSFTVAQTNVSCNGGSNGSATVTVSGGTSGYTYSWSPTGGTAATATGLTAGTYTCTITDANSCTTTASVTITQPNVMTVDAGPTTVTYCANAITPITATNISTNFQGAYAPANWAFANANADGNVNTTNAPASITITGGNNNGDNFFGGSPGDSSYSITFTPNTTVSFNWAYSTDDGGFSDYPQVIVNGVATIMQGYNINTSRPETQSGTMTVNVTAGQTFAFNMHTVDNKFGAATVTISNLVISNSDGSYSWVATNGGSITGATNTANMTPATSGTYTVTATNANGCSATDSVAVIIATATTSQTDVSCNGGSNGAINLTPTGGTAPYTFNWGGGITTEDRTGLAAGTYTCTITDASSCITTTSVTITEPTALVANLTTQTNVSCNGGPTGSATVSVSGGTSGYTYSWSPSGGTAATASGLAAGTYTCTITDANSCTTTASVTITQPTVIDFTTTVLSGYDYNTGYSQTIVASGGTGSKTYAVTAGSLPSGFSLSTAGQITGISTQIADSNFTVTATDANSCSATYDYILKLNQIPITVTATPSQTKVYGESEPVLTYTASPSLLSGDSFTGSLTRVSGKNIGNYAINQGSLSAGSKYLITYAGANFSITAKPITVTADAKTKVYGAVDPSLTYSVSPSLVGTDVFTGTLTRVSGENVSTYAIEQNDLSAGSNYAITYEAEDFAITAKPITVTADAKTKVYGAVDPSLTYSVSPSLVGTDGFTGTLTRVAGENVGTYAITQGDLSAGSNYTIAYVAKDFAITAKPITVTADASQTKVYGATDPSLTYSVSPGLVGTDAFTGTLARVAGENVNTYAITQGDLSAGSNYTIAYVAKDFAITAKPITVTADASQTKVYGTTDPSLTYSVSPSLVGTDVFTGTLSRVAGENVNTYAITQGDLSAGSNYTIAYVAKDFAITAKPITVTADASQTKVYGTTDPSLTYSVSPSLVGTDVFTGTLSRVAGENVNTYAITQGDLSAGSNYTIAYVAKDFAITAKPITVTADASQTKVYGTTDPSLTYSVSPSLVGTDAFTGTLSRVAGENVGTYAITQGDLSAGSNYTIAYVAKDFAITAKPITVTADASQTKVYGATDPSLTYSASPSLAGTDTFTGTLSRVVGENAGTYAIAQGTLSAGANYTISFVSSDFTIAAKPITVTADASQTKVYGTTDPSLTYSVSPSLVGTDAFIGALARVAGENVGTYAIEQNNLSAGSNYTIAYVAKDFAITAKPITVTADASQTKVYGTTDPSLTYSVSPSLVGTDVFTGTLSRVAGENVGTYAIEQNNLSAGSNYTITYVAKDFAITAKPINVTAAAKTKVYGTTEVPLTYIVTPSLLSGDSFTGALNRAIGENVGTYAISQNTLSAGANYVINFVSANYNITKANQEITWNQTLVSDCGSSASIALTATSTSGLGISFSSSNSNVATIVNNELVFVNPGSATITASQVGDNNFNAAPSIVLPVVNSQPNLIRKQFEDVIFFDNSSNQFVAYTWYKNGVVVAGQTAQYFKETGVLNGTYYAVATKKDGTLISTCPLVITSNGVVETMNIAPNPVRSNSSYQLITNIESAKIQNARVTVFNILGSLMTDKVVNESTIEMVAPSVDGIYIVKLTLSNGKMFTKNLLVRN